MKIYYHNHGFYIEGLHPVIPVGSVEITPEYHAELLDKQSAGYSIEPDKRGYPVAVPPPSPTPGEVRARMVAVVNAAFETACTALLADEPPSATATYAVQQAEAESWNRNNSEPTPMLDMLAHARGIDKGELVRRVLAKAALYAQASGLLLGQQQRLMDDITAIMATPDLSDDLKIVALEQLNIHIGLPSGGEE